MNRRWVIGGVVAVAVLGAAGWWAPGPLARVGGRPGLRAADA